MCPLGTSLSSWLDFRGAPLSRWTSIKRVGDLQAFSVSEECLVFGPVYSHVVLRPRPGYVPKVPTTPFRDQVVNLQALPSEEADPVQDLFFPQFSSLDGEPWWNPPSTPGSQTRRSSLTPGPVLVLARPGLRSAPVLG